MAEQEGKQAIIIQLPWAVPQQPLVTTQIQVDPQTQTIPLDLNVISTDWVAVGAIGLSLLAFLVTIYIVRESTKSQIESNKQLIEKQNELKLAELRISNRKEEVDRLRNSIYEYISVIQNFKYYYIQVFYFKKYGNFLK